MDDKLYGIVEYILNIADPPDLEVIQAALKKRLSDDRKGGPILGLNPAKLAAESTGRINHQLDASKQMVTNMAVSFAADIIRQNAPELNEDQVQELVSGFMPELAGGSPARKKASSGSARDDGSLPSGMIIQMVVQFIDYSEGAMSAGEQVQMEQEIPGWKKKFWKSFPGQVQKLISLYLNGDIDRQRFDAHVYEVLGL
jgi:mannose/fructose-specific phosphotransferase system component IIA